ncbi:hypothetical protein [Wolbachia endosymbiont of Ctenocephalides felis wCfeJ]|uniref:hypothetical protein n=1 Tax=Wolbachia endosymbiont of Ctenocephalides felis wCfeJ TaxID=2732594 RepID=UPI001445A8F8|nr:hypothetical protein [Wolbachia endosymbiont of Ctenocephalides felis wCfeJ]WCR57688.1 MAG: hypothetical protein PG980_000160 [Wolbachia endosymbiont of Ctenocephalides felis wCfeJ]
MAKVQAWSLLILLFLMLNSNVAYTDKIVISSCDKVPLDYNGKVFRIKTDYPTKISDKERPWEHISFIEEPQKYADTILKYIYNGNTICDFDLHCNKVADWYHAPWMHYGVNGREFVNGLTRERSFKPGELHNNQKSIIQNWAISIINEQGAYTYGQVWQDIDNPDITKGQFLDGTVSAKLVFTEATQNDIPSLKNSVTWTAYINQSDKGTQKVFKQIRLFQIDFLVKDKRSEETGWVAGTFIYDSTINNRNPWLNMKLVGVAWGNDSNYFTADYIIGKKLLECWINPDVVQGSLGYLGRLNGPVDNKQSSCLSCHSTAQYPEKSSSVPPKQATEREIKYWFRNFKGKSFDGEAFNFDYSKQLSHGIRNYHSAKKENDPIGCNNFNRKDITQASIN